MRAARHVDAVSENRTAFMRVVFGKLVILAPSTA